MLLVTENDVSESAIVLTRRELSRSQLELGESRDSCWKRLFEPIYNDETLQFTFDFGGMIDNVDPILIQNEYRGEAELKGKFHDVRSLFSVVMSKRQRARQNEVYNFHKFRSRDRRCGGL